MEGAPSKRPRLSEPNDAGGELDEPAEADVAAAPDADAAAAAASLNSTVATLSLHPMSQARAANAAASAGASEQRRAKKRENEAKKKQKKNEEVAVKCVRLVRDEYKEGVDVQSGNAVDQLKRIEDKLRTNGKLQGRDEALKRSEVCSAQLGDDGAQPRDRVHFCYVCERWAAGEWSAHSGRSHVKKVEAIMLAALKKVPDQNLPDVLKASGLVETESEGEDEEDVGAEAGARGQPRYPAAAADDGEPPPEVLGVRWATVPRPASVPPEDEARWRHGLKYADRAWGAPPFEDDIDDEATSISVDSLTSKAQEKSEPDAAKVVVVVQEQAAGEAKRVGAINVGPEGAQKRPRVEEPARVGGSEVL